jgi:hypothetical protein
METKSEQKTLAQLEQFQDELTAQLETALSSENDIDPDLIISIRSRLNALPLKITAAKIAETKARLNEIHDELLTAEQNKRLKRGEQLERKNELNEKLRELDPFYERYNESTVQLSFISIEEDGLRIARREHKALLFSLSDSIKKI